MRPYLLEARPSNQDEGPVTEDGQGRDKLLELGRGPALDTPRLVVFICCSEVLTYGSVSDYDSIDQSILNINSYWAQ